MFDAKLASLIPGFDTRWLMEGKSECPTEVEYGGRRFWVFGHLVRTGGRGGGFLATTYWVDITEFCLIRDKFNASRPVNSCRTHGESASVTAAVAIRTPRGAGSFFPSRFNQKTPQQTAAPSSSRKIPMK